MLKDAAVDCLATIRFDDDAKKVFNSARVRNGLNTVLELVIRALELISRYYESRISKPFEFRCRITISCKCRIPFLDSGRRIQSHNSVALSQSTTSRTLHD